MHRSVKKLKPIIPGGLVGGLLLFLAMISLSTLLPENIAGSLKLIFQSAYLQNVILFTFKQAFLSTFLSLIFGGYLAYCLYTMPHFKGKGLICSVLYIPFVTPTIIAIFMIVAVYGRSGWLNQLLQFFGLPEIQLIYNLTGILIAHVFFNMFFIARNLIAVLENIPKKYYMLAQQYGFSKWQVFCYIEWHEIKKNLPSLFFMVFLLCFTSFAIVLTLGGGPKSTTIEVALYYALKVEYDLEKVFILSLIQILFCLALYICVHKLFPYQFETSIQKQEVFKQPPLSYLQRIAQSIYLVMAFLFLLLPYLSIVIEGLTGPMMRVFSQTEFWLATLQSLGLAFAGAILCIILCSAVLISSRYAVFSNGQKNLASFLESLSYFIYIIPSLILAIGLFLFFREWQSNYLLKLILALSLYAVLGMPFAQKILKPIFYQSYKQYHQQIELLGLSFWQGWKWIYRPLIAPRCWQAFGLCAAFMLGDLGIILIFGHQDFQTLSFYIYDKIGRYQMAEAAVASLWMLCVTASLFLFTHYWGKKKHDR